MQNKHIWYQTPESIPETKFQIHLSNAGAGNEIRSIELKSVI